MRLIKSFFITLAIMALTTLLIFGGIGILEFFLENPKYQYHCMAGCFFLYTFGCVYFMGSLDEKH